ncbi:MAG: Rv1355c family protein [Myxococcales bacterium]|nr:Rv1355c family protein [Myxococcales bacterium]
MADAQNNFRAILDELSILCVTHHHGGEMWRPRMFRPADPDEAQGLVDLLRNSGEIVVYDTLGAQLRELVETRNPGAKLDRRDMARLIEAELGGVPPIQYGVWVYYPWSRRLVHMLDRAEFVELRTNRNRYKITAEEQQILMTKRIGIVGLSVGQSVALTLAMERSMGEVRLADFDTLGLSNLNRLRAGVHSLGVPKVYLTAREIAEIDPFIVVKCYPDGVAQDTIDDFLLSGGPLDLLIDECDSLDIKVWLRHHARNLKIPVLMETSDRCLVDVERYDLEPERPIFHGLVGDLHPEQLGGLSNNDKVPYVLQIIGEPTISDRARASMLEVGSSIKTWPQLASAVTMGGGIAADVARRMNLGYLRDSGRFWVDIEKLIPDVPKPEPPRTVRTPPRPLEHETMLALAASVPPPAAPVVTLSPQQRDALVGAALLAPSGGNCQPWRWLAEGTRLHLFHDRVRSTSLADYASNGAMVAFGAASENMVLAAHAEGLEVSLDLFPAGEASDLVASFAFHERDTPEVEPHWRDRLSAHIGGRHTNRKVARHRLDPAAIQEMIEAARSVGAELEFLEADNELAALGRIVGAADRVRLLNEDYNREMMAELRWTPEEAMATRDGLALDTLELSRIDRAGVEMSRSISTLRYLRAWGGGQGIAKAGMQAIMNSGAVGLVTMPRAGQRDYFVGGRAVERMWLVAQSHGLAIQPMTIICYMFARVLRGGGEGLDPASIEEIKRLRAPYRRLFSVQDDTAEVLLFRISRAEPASARSLRRGLADMLVIA